ncbi:hypothetical protein DU002_11545 [Corallincola holothuriorum]|uniref:Ricin B lectin domain-containing protein n=1 Tax=Corallincola holothuriorum TaxID=2282215 RepID=A0A368NIR5_9GAMM|nr:RICIN domain-containing protein [Corallincola holothuriorum]RCU49544.1 hypothetical protein DU002_11545 [Corallincola holothuriorum]
MELKQWFRGMVLVATSLMSIAIHAEDKVTIDLNTQKFVGGVSELDRSKYFNIHMTALENQVTQEELDYLVNDLNIGFGRQFWSPFSAHKGHGSYPDPATAKSNGERNVQSTKKHPNYAFLSTRNIVTDHPKAAYTAGQDPVKAAAWAANYFKYYFDDTSRPLFYEPINEPFVHAGEFGISDDKARAEMTQLFKEIGRKFDQDNINTQVIGYSSAWPSMELWDFGHFNGRMKQFMDEAGPYIDSFSVHPYDGVNVTGANNQRSGSNLEAILDLLETYSHYKWDRVKPVTISEYGGIEKGYGDGYSDIKSVQSIRSINNMLFQLLDRQDRLLTSIPFITGKAAWHYNAGNNWAPYGAVVLRPDPSSISNGKPQRFFWTPRIHFYQLWANVTGHRVKALSSNEDVQVQAFVDGNKAYVALNSLAETEQSVSLAFVNEMGQVTNVRQKQLKIYANSKPVYRDENNVMAPSSLTLIPGETVVIEYTFAEAIQFTESLDVATYYSDDHLQSIIANKALTFRFRDVKVATGHSLLKLSLGRSHQRSKKPTVMINGTKVSVPSNWKGGDQSSRGEFFGAIHIPVDNQLLSKNPVVTVTFPDNGGRVSSVVLEVHSGAETSGKEDTIRFADQISELAPADSYTVNVEYSASIGRDLVLELWHQDQYIASTRKSVSAGSDVTALTVSLPQPTVSGATGYLFKASIRPVGADWQSNIDNVQINGIRIEAANAPSEDLFEFAELITELESGTRYRFAVRYSATQARDLVVEVWDGSNWLAAGKTAVNAGAGTTDVFVDLNEAPLAGANDYQLKGAIRPTNTTWRENIDTDQLNDISIISPLPKVDDISFAAIERQQDVGSRFSFKVAYAATEQRDVVVEFWSADTWLGEATETVPAGESTVTLTVDLGYDVEAGEGYIAKSSIRPVGSSWTENLATDQINDITLQSAALQPSTGWVNLQLRHSQRCMDVANGNTNNGSIYHQWSCNTNNANQRFRFEEQGSGWYSIRSQVSDKCLDLAYGSKNNGAKLQQYSCQGSNQNQHWRIVDLGDGWFELRSRKSDKCADIKGVSEANGANMHQWQCINGLNQQFRFMN